MCYPMSMEGRKKENRFLCRNIIVFLSSFPIEFGSFFNFLIVTFPSIVVVLYN